ncbi:hypothetical protein chiPu_0022346, partial [Chiloscyllium punctatum]|nr:hypothetical protein [Chiloscyllium punctatum]
MLISKLVPLIAGWGAHPSHQKGRLLLFHESSLISTTIAVVSASLSYSAAVFILFFALGKYKVYKRHLQLTTVFVFCQMIALLCVLISSLLCTLDPVFPLEYRIVEAFGFVFISAIIFYNIFYYLHPESQLRRSFLAKQ